MVISNGREEKDVSSAAYAAMTPSLATEGTAHGPGPAKTVRERKTHHGVFICCLGTCPHTLYSAVSSLVCWTNCVHQPPYVLLLHYTLACGCHWVQQV